MVERVEASEKLEQEVNRLQDLKNTLDPLSDEYKKVHDMCNDLLRIRDSEMKLDKEIDDREENIALEQEKLEVQTQSKTEELRARLEELKVKQTETVVKERNGIIQIAATAGVTLLGILANVAFHSYWNTKGFEFEETGTFTSSVFRESKNKKINKN